MRTGQQLRVASVGMPGGGSMSQPIGLDFGAVLAFGGAVGVDMEMLADVLPGVEIALLSRDDDSSDDI